jgi:phosphoribosylformylglycinamidine synthase
MSCSEQVVLTRVFHTVVENTSSQFEARLSMVKIEDRDARNSVFFSDMSGSSLPIVVSHGEGRAQFASPHDLQSLSDDGLIPLRYTDNYGAVTERYPSNPNGSPQGLAGVRSRDGRVVAMMPHPERTIMGDVGSWRADNLKALQYGPWFRLFLNARKWVA